jgi:HlyD family secretion protein
VIGGASRLWTEPKSRIILIAVLASTALLGIVCYSNRSPSIPTIVVKPGDFIDSVHFRGEVKALKSVSIVSPAEAGDFQIVKIVADGTPVQQGDVIVEFDHTKTAQDVAQYRSTLHSSQAEIDQTRAQARLTEEDDLTALLKARYDVETAKLDASKEEIVSKIEGAESKLKVADAEQKVRELEEKLKADRTASQSTVHSKTQARHKAEYDVQRGQRALGSMKLKAPRAGMISLIPVWHPNGEATFKPGDRVWPGALIAELPDVSTLRISARVEENERGRLALHQKVTVHLDAIPDREFSGTIEQISTIASTDFSGGWPFPRNFDSRITLDQHDARLKPGMTAELTVVVEKIPDALVIPAQASFQRSGQTIAYVWDRSKFRERVIEIGRKSGDRILVTKGLRPNDQVALADPTAKE